MSYQIVSDPPPQRDAAAMSTDPGPDGVAPYDFVGPGLYTGETVVQLDTGELIALSVARKRRPNGGGMDFRGWARVIEEDGSTKLDPAGQEMELEFPHGADAGTMQSIGDDAEAVISREIMLMMIGAPATMRDVPVEEGQDPERAPIVGWAEDVRLNTSIRYAIDMAAKTTAEVDVAALLAPPSADR